MEKVVSVTCPKCENMFEAELPKPERKRGILHGIALQDMTDEQLKRELINSKSVLYKAKQRGADEKTVAANEARVNAALAEKDSRQGTASDAAASDAGEGIASDTPEDGASVYAENPAAAEEI